MLRQASRARLFKEYKEVQREKSADPDIQLVCDDSNIFKLTALIKGHLKLLMMVEVANVANDCKVFMLFKDIG